MINIYKNNKEFILKLFTIAFPILLQNFISSSLNFVDALMVGRLSEIGVASVGIGNQIYFLFLMLFFSIASGTSIFTAQYWGKKDLKKIHTTTGIGLTISISSAVILSLFVFIFSKNLVGLFNTDIDVVTSGTSYTRIVSISFIVMSLSFLYGSILRSTENIKLPVIAGLTAIVINTSLNYLLIFGNLGFPKLGVEGAAIATVISRLIEASIIISVSYYKKYPIFASLKQLFSYTKSEVSNFMKTVLPVMGQSMGWSFGYILYGIIYGRISTEAFAAYYLANSAERICLIVFTSLGSACAIMVGNNIGADRIDTAKKYSKNFIFITIVSSIILSLILISLRGSIIGLYNIDEKTKSYLFTLLLVVSLIIVAKGLNIMYMMGILKAGGDTLFAMIVDSGGIWFIGIPIASISAFIFGLPVYYVMLLAATEEFVKMTLCSYRFISKKWLKKLA